MTSSVAGRSALEASPQPVFGVRIADIAAMLSDGSTIIGQRKIPTTPLFDQAFGAFAQGTRFLSPNGYISVEDLRPGDQLNTADGGQETVTWIGSATFSPNDLGDRMRLTRVMSDSFGVNRPQSFVSFGSAARVLQTPADLRGVTGDKKLMTTASRFVDGVNVIEVTPPTPTRLFHIGMRTHSVLISDGLEVESYHPGAHPMKTCLLYTSDAADD